MNDGLDYLSRLAELVEKIISILEMAITKVDVGINEIARRHRKKMIIKIVVLFDRLLPGQLTLPDVIDRYVRRPTSGNWYMSILLINRITSTIQELSVEIKRLCNFTLFEYRDELRPLLMTLEARRSLFDCLESVGVPREVIINSREYRQAIVWSQRRDQLQIDREARKRSAKQLAHEESAIQRAIERESIGNLIDIGDDSFPRPTEKWQLQILKSIAKGYLDVIKATNEPLKRLSNKISRAEMLHAESELEIKLQAESYPKHF